jgi:YVTN family beta-propeller protein
MHQPVRKLLRRDNVVGIAVLTISLAAALVTIGCGNQYRPVVSAIGPVGPAGQTTKYAVVVATPSPGTSAPGLLTDVDFSGDTVLATPQLLSNPSYFQIASNGSEGYALNAQGSMDFFPLTSPGTLITSSITETTLPVDAAPVSITELTPASGIPTVFIPQAGTNTIAALNASSAALYDTVGIEAGGTNPVYVVGAASAPRVYAISQNAPGSNGQVDALETVSTTSLSDSARIPVGIKPVYGVMTTDDRRAFILNQGSGTVSVINVISNALDTFLPTITIPQIVIPGGGTMAPNPVWADLDPTESQFVVLNQGDGVHPGTLSIISIPLCNPAAPNGNPNCVASNPVDAAGFGQIIATAPVGINPTMVSVMQGLDGNTPAAFVINQFDNSCAPTIDGSSSVVNGSVTVVNLQTGLITATICGVSGNAATVAANGTSNLIFGHPNSISATGGEPTGKVYVTSSDNTYLSVIYTDTNSVTTHIPLQGMGLRVLVTAPYNK